MFDWFTPEYTVVASIIISLLSYFLSFRIPNDVQGRMLRMAAFALIICSSVFWWAITSSFTSGFAAIAGGFGPILIYHLIKYFYDQPGLFGSSVEKDVSQANFQFNSKKPAPKVEVEQAVEKTTEDTGE